MSAQSITRRLTQSDLAKLYQAGEKIVMFTCYDASFARLLDGAGVESLLIGDSLGNVIQGHDTTLPVTVADIAYHVAAVKRGSDHPFIIADMPFGSYQEAPEQAFRNAVTLMAAGAQMVKLEGGREMAATVEFLVHRGIPVCGHVGLTPQSVHALGGYKVQGKGEAAAQRLKDDALALQNAGATMIVLEAIPAVLAAEVTAQLCTSSPSASAPARTARARSWWCTTPSTSRRARRPGSSATSWTVPAASPMPPPAPSPPSRTAAIPAPNTPTPHRSTPKMSLASLRLLAVQMYCLRRPA